MRKWLGPAMAVGLGIGVVVACGSSDSGGGGAAGSGATDGGSGTGGTAGSSGSGAAGGSSGSGASGGSAGTGAAGGTAGAAGSGCVDPATLPPVSAPDLVVSDSCPAATACGGSLDGTKWGLASLCVSAADLFGNTISAIKSVCNTATTSTSVSSEAGSLSFAGGQMTLSVHASASLQVTLPNNCSFCQCTQMEQQLNSAGVNASCSPVCNGGDCTCFVDGSYDLDKSEAYTASGSSVSTASGGFDYCVDAGKLDLAGSGSLPGAASFRGPSPERCDGIDDDLDGVVDNDPVDCPPCLDKGVCAGNTTITCTGSWKCDYTSPDYEATETKCDGLDNDCNGVVDDKPAVDQTCAATNPDAQCISGACACPQMCNGVCTHPDVDAKNCGTCGKTCPIACSGATCVGVKDLDVDYDPCAVLDDGSVRCWGFNGSGELGDGTKTNSPKPVPVLGLSNVTRISASSQHMCALLGDGSVECWGAGGSGELGDGTGASHMTATAVPGLANVTQVTSGFYHTCVLLQGGSVECWGDNGWGQIGDGTTANRLSPTPVALTGVKSVVAGGTDTCAIMNDTTLQCWGLNSHGQLGDGTSGNQRQSPQPVPGLTGVVDVAPSGNHTCALMSDATVKCWGLNNAGQLGDGTTAEQHSPQTVPGLAGVKRISVGSSHSCATLGDGSAVCWGDNQYGQLGDGTTTERDVPTPVTGLASDALVVAGGDMTCALLPDATVRCWGWNNYGQLGDGSTTNRSAPTPVVW